MNYQSKKWNVMYHGCIAMLLMISVNAAAQDKSATIAPAAGSGSPSVTEQAPIGDRSAPDEAPPAKASAPETYVLPAITPGKTMSLAEALDAVDRRNLSLETARVEIDKADAMVKQAWTGVLPNVSGEITFLHHDHEDAFNMPIPGMEGKVVVVTQEDLKGSLSVAMPLVHPQSWYQIKTAKKGAELAGLSIEAVRQQMLTTTAEAYYTALMAHQVIDLHLSAIEVFTEHLRVAEVKLSAGAGLKIDVIRASTDRDQAYQQLLTAHMAFDNARDAIKVLTGAEDLPMPVEGPALIVPSGTDDALADQAITSRADLKAKHSAVDLAQVNLKTSWMQFLPTFDAVWQGSYQFTDTGGLGSSDKARWLIMLKLSVPLYNHFRYGDLDLRRAEIRKTTLEQQDGEIQASMMVRVLRRNYLTALATIEIAERQALMGREGLALVEAAYEAGTGSSMEVTDARRTALSADVNLAAKKLEAQMALLKLLSAIGEDMSKLAR